MSGKLYLVLGNYGDARIRRKNQPLPRNVRVFLGCARALPRKLKCWSQLRPRRPPSISPPPAPQTPLSKRTKRRAIENPCLAMFRDRSLDWPLAAALASRLARGGTAPRPPDQPSRSNQGGNVTHCYEASASSHNDHSRRC